ncbi:hypothetical protein ASG20_10880 [Sphingomonas sp. Leaf198]|nr:hypothetical protein ASG20_10880 [Sphingomonas sp. Leaf198]
MTSTKKSCIFCGAAFAGQKRNFEHIIPAWLVREADLRSRDMQVELPGISRKVAMSRIGLKVCKGCNDADSDLEARAKEAYLAVKGGEDLSDAHIYAMLDWLDKVRIGLWLWLIEQVGEEFRTGAPKFRINGRLGRKDRLLLIQRYPEGPPMRGLALQGLGEFYIGLPSAIGLLVNNISLTSISSDFLALRHIRNVRVLQSSTMGDLTGFSLVPDAVDEPRLKLLGGASTFAQCILPDADFAEFDIPVHASSSREPGWSVSPVLRLDGNLREAAPATASVPVFTGNVAANSVLMERNVYEAAAFLIRDLQRADNHELDTEAKEALSTDLRNALASVEAGRRELGMEYQSLTGLQLP